MKEYVTSHFGFEAYACGLCQTGVPCESRIPLPDALVVAMGITATLLYRRGVACACAVGISLILFAVLSLSLAPEASRTRLEELMAGEGVDGSARSDLYDVVRDTSSTILSGRAGGDFFAFLVMYEVHKVH